MNCVSSLWFLGPNGHLNLPQRINWLDNTAWKLGFKKQTPPFPMPHTQRQPQSSWMRTQNEDDLLCKNTFPGDKLSEHSLCTQILWNNENYACFASPFPLFPLQPFCQQWLSGSWPMRGYLHTLRNTVESNQTSDYRESSSLDMNSTPKKSYVELFQVFIRSFIQGSPSGWWLPGNTASHSHAAPNPDAQKMSHPYIFFVLWERMGEGQRGGGGKLCSMPAAKLKSIP